MRYFIVTYMQKPSGQMDEVVEVARNTKKRHVMQASVVLDFKKQDVVKCSLGATQVPRDWERIRDFYHQHYKDIIEQLEQANGKTETNTQDNPN